MLGRSIVCALAGLVIALAGCGGDDGGDSSAPPKEPVVRCTPVKAGAKSVTVKPKWKIGNRRTVEIQKSREDTQLDDPIRVSGTAELRVIDADSSGASFRWTAGVVSLPLGAVQIPDDDLDEVHEKVDPLRLEYSTDSDGALSQLGNVSSLRTQVSAMIDALAEVSGQDEDTEPLRRVMESETFLRTVMVEDPSYLHNVYGVSLKRGEKVSGEYALPNPFGGQPIPATASYTLTTPRDRNGCAVIDVTIDADPDTLGTRLREGVNEFAPGEAPPESEYADMTLRHELSFSYDPGSGWFARTEARKIVTQGERKRTDRILLVTRPG
jgi:hypothetical protein